MNSPPPNLPQRLFRFALLACTLGILAFYVSAYYVKGAFVFPLNLMFEPDPEKIPDAKFEEVCLLEGDPVTALTFTSGPRLNDDLLVSVKKYPKVQKIIFFSANIGDRGMVHLQGLRELRDLTINSINLSDRGLEHLKGLPSVEKLDITNTNVGDAGLAHIKAWPALRSLRLAHTHVSDAGMKTVSEMAKLEELYLMGTAVTDAGLAQLAGSKTLRVLWPTKHTTDRGLEHLRGLHQMEEIELNNTPITDAGLAHLAGWKLKKIGVEGTKITTAGLRHLQKSDLTWLDLANTPIGDDALAWAGECPNLRTLKVAGTKISDDGMAKLQGLTHLESLDVGGCTGVTDKGVAALATLPKLGTLWLSGTKITDAGLVELAKMSELADVWLFNTKITEDGLKMLRKALPKLIMHQNVTFNVNHFERIGTRGEMVIISPWGPLPEEAANPDSMISRTAVEIMQCINDSGCVCNARAADNRSKLHFDKPVSDLATLAEVIDHYSEKGKRPFEAITIWGHTGLKYGMFSPGICLQKAAGRTGNPPGFRFDFPHLESADGAKAILAIRRGLAPEGYLRIAGCGYKYTVGETPREWEMQVDALAKQIGVPVIFPESKPGNTMNRFNMQTLKTGQLCHWHAALP
jgi:hypothetical protein